MLLVQNSTDLIYIIKLAITTLSSEIDELNKCQAFSLSVKLDMVKTVDEVNKINLAR